MSSSGGSLGEPILNRTQGAIAVLAVVAIADCRVLRFAFHAEAHVSRIPLFATSVTPGEYLPGNLLVLTHLKM